MLASVVHVEGLGEVEVFYLVGSLSSAVGPRDLEIWFIFVVVVLRFRLDSTLMP